MSELPPGTEYRNGSLVRVIPKVAPDGTPWEQVRPVSLDPIEAKAKQMDYYHPQLGWMLKGKKLVKDRSVGSRMLDDSQAVAVPEEARPGFPVIHNEMEEVRG